MSRETALKKLSKKSDDQQKLIKNLAEEKECYKTQLSILEQVESKMADSHKEMEQKVKLLNAEVHIFFSYVMASGGLYSLILHHNSQSLVIIFVHWTQLLVY